MKSFQNLAYNIVEKRTTPGFGSPSGYDDQGEAKYTKRPGPKEPGRRATVQKSPKTVSQVKGEIEAAKRFAGARSGGLDTRNVPSFVTQRRKERANRLLGPDPWDMPGGASGGQKTFERGLRKLASPSGPTRGHRERAFRDFVNQSSKELGTTTDEIIASMIKGKSATPFASPVPAAPDPWRPSETATPSSKIKTVLQTSAPEKPKVQKTAPSQRVTTSTGGTPKAVSFSTPTRSKSSKSKTSVIDAEVIEPKKSPELKLGTEPGGKMEPRGVKKTPTKGVTAGLGPVKNTYDIEPVTVKVLKSKPKSLAAPKPPKIALKSKVTTPSSKPAVVAPPAAKVKPLPKLNLDKYKAPTVNLGTLRKVTTPKPAVSSITKTPQSQKLADTVLKVSKQIRSDIAAEKAAQSAKTAKALSGAAKAAGVVGAGIEAKGAYDAAKASGASEKRSIGAGAARALGSLAGSAIGGTLGSVLGPAGSVVGGVAGYSAGAELGSKAYKAVTGDYKKKVTTQGVLSNIRKAVPQQVRAQVPSGARKAFTDIVTQMGKTYGNWQRSQEAKK